MITIVFHALLPSPLWKWDDTSDVYIRFDSSRLGNFQSDCGPMVVVRYEHKCYSDSVHKF